MVLFVGLLPCTPRLRFFWSRLRVLRAMCILTALHGAEASCDSDRGIFRLRSAFVRGSWSGRLTLAYPGPILTVLDGPVGSDPAFHIVWCRFRVMRRFLAYTCSVLETARIYHLLGGVVAGASGHGPVHILLEGTGTNGFAWDPVLCVWVRPGLPQLSTSFSLSVLQECCLRCLVCHGCLGPWCSSGFSGWGGP